MKKIESFLKTKYGFLVSLACVTFAIAARYFEHVITEYNSTPFAMTYKYGFLSRAFLGTVYGWIDKILPGNQMTNEGIYWFTFTFTVICLLMFFVFFSKSLDRVSDTINDTSQLGIVKKNIMYLATVLMLLSASEFVTEEMYGRFDTYLVILSFVCLILLVEEKLEWLIVPICILCMLIHQGFVFTNANAILVVIFAKALMNEGAKRRRYLGLLVVTLAVISGFFLYFEFFSHVNGQKIATDIIRDAKKLSVDGKSYNKSLITHEILGQGVFADEMEYHMDNYREFPSLLILGIPFIAMAIHFFKGLFKDNIGGDYSDVKFFRNRNFWINLAVLAGGFTIVPEMILKVDYGRYTYMTFFYYIVVMMAIMALGYQPVCKQIQASKDWVKSLTPFPQAILIYVFFMTPLFDVIINGASYKLSTWLFFWIK